MPRSPSTDTPTFSGGDSVNPPPMNAVLEDLARGEELIPLAELVRSPLIPRRNGRKPHARAAFRWHSRGVRGVRLEAAQTTAGLATSRSGVLRFFARLSGSLDGPAPAVTDHRTRERQLDRVDSQLAAAGL